MFSNLIHSPEMSDSCCVLIDSVGAVVQWWTRGTSRLHRSHLLVRGAENKLLYKMLELQVLWGTMTQEEGVGTRTGIHHWENVDVSGQRWWRRGLPRLLFVEDLLADSKEASEAGASCLSTRIGMRNQRRQEKSHHDGLCRPTMGNLPFIFNEMRSHFTILNGGVMWSDISS